MMGAENTRSRYELLLLVMVHADMLPIIVIIAEEYRVRQIHEKSFLRRFEGFNWI